MGMLMVVPPSCEEEARFRGVCPAAPSPSIQKNAAVGARGCDASENPLIALPLSVTLAHALGKHIRSFSVGCPLHLR